MRIRNFSFLPFLTLPLLALLLLSPAIALLSLADLTLLRETIQKPNFTGIVAATLISSAGGAAISVLIGLFFARAFALYDWPFKRAQRLLALIPFLVPNFVLAAAYVVAWNPQTGLLNSATKFPFGLYGLWGMTWIFAVAHAPIALLTLEDKFKRIDLSLREAAQMSGASSWRVFRSIELPLLAPSLVAAFALSFILNISAFAIPAWIGAPERSYTLAYKVYQAVQIGGPEGFPQSAVYALVLVGIVILALGVSLFADRNQQRYIVVSGKASRGAETRVLGRAFVLFQILFWPFQIFSWIGPLASLFASTLVPPGCLQSTGLSCLASPSLKTYIYVLTELPETSLAFKGSFLYGSIASVLILSICCGVLVLGERSRITLQAASWMSTLASAMPGAVVALGLIVVYSGRFEINLYNTAWIVVLAFVIKHMHLALQPLRTGLAGISHSLVEAGRMSGAGSRQIWTRILLPILRPEIVGGFFLVLVPILGELTMSVFLVSPQFRSIGTLLFDLQDYADQASAAALSVILVISVLCLNELAKRLSSGRIGY